MRFKTTAILGLVVVCLGMMIRVVNHRPEAGAGAAARANVLVRFPSTEVNRIEIEQGTSRVVVEKKNELWFFTEPEQDRVDASIVAALLDELNHLAIADTIAETEIGQSPVQLGVQGDRAVKLRISGRTEEDREIFESLTLGVSAPRAGSIYARRGEEGETFVVGGNPRRWVEQPLLAMRDARLVSAPAEAIVQLGIRRSTGELVLHRKVTPPQQEWALMSPLQAWASPEKMDQLLADLAALRIEEVVPGADAGEKIPNPLPEGAAVLQIRVIGIEQPLTVYMEEVEPPAVDGAPSLIEARVSDRPGVYRFHSSVLEALPASANDVRNRTLSAIPPDYLESIFIQSPLDPDVILKARRTGDGLRWEVNVNNRLLPANLGEVSRLVSGVNEAAILDFASDTGEDLASFGLRPPKRRLTFNLQFPSPANPDGSPGEMQEAQRVLDLGWREGEEERLFANFEGEPFVYELDPTFLSLVTTHPIKWRSLSILNINPFHLQSITRELVDRDKLKLSYDYRRDDWEALRNGVDVTATLDVASARRLRDRLGSLTATGWVLSLGNAYEALQSPSARFHIVTSELDPAIGEAAEKIYQVNFAPATASLYFGQVVGANDVFFVDHETYRDLIRPVTTSRAAE